MKITSYQTEDEEERKFEQTLRPESFTNFVGQGKIKENLYYLLEAAKKRGESPDHILFFGPPGLGKTTLAHIVAKELSAELKTTTGPSLERVGDIASIVSNIPQNGVLFLDEIHRLRKQVEEALYPILEDFRIDVVIGKGQGARIVKIDLPHFTLVGATTRAGMISSPLRSRFGVTLRLDYYSDSELAQIMERSSEILNFQIDKNHLKKLAKRARGTPRIANRLIKRVRDFVEVGGKRINDGLIDECLDLLGVDENGLDDLDRRYIDTLEKKFGGGPVGLKTIAAAISEDPETLEDMVEPFLIRQGLISKTARGRALIKLLDI